MHVLGDRVASIEGARYLATRIPGAKLAAEEVRMILTRHQQGHPHPVIAKAYGVSASAVRAIATGRTWTHVTGLERRP